MFKRVLFATDGSTASLLAAEALATIACHSPEVSVRVVAAVGPEAGRDTCYALAPSNALDQARRAVRGACTVFHIHGIPYDGHVVEGDCACTAIAEAAKQDLCDLIVMSSRERPSTANGGEVVSLTEEVVQRASVPVLVIPPGQPIPGERSGVVRG